jgi:hypothetical protein
MEIESIESVLDDFDQFLEQYTPPAGIDQKAIDAARGLHNVVTQFVIGERDSMKKTDVKKIVVDDIPKLYPNEWRIFEETQGALEVSDAFQRWEHETGRIPARRDFESDFRGFIKNWIQDVPDAGSKAITAGDIPTADKFPIASKFMTGANKELFHEPQINPFRADRRPRHYESELPDQFDARTIKLSQDLAELHADRRGDPYAEKYKVSIGNMIGMMEKKDPTLWNYLYPRMYKDVDRFHDPRAFAMHSFGLFESIRKEGIDNVSKSVHDILFKICILSHFNFPLFFVEKDLLHSVMQTTPPDVIDWLKMDFPFESITFVLPRGGIVVRPGVEIQYISIGRVRAGKYELAPPFQSNTVAVDAPFLSITATDECVVTHTRVLSKPFIPGENYGVPDSLRSDKSILELEPANKDLNDTLTRVAFNLIFAMLARPRLVESGRKYSVHKKRKNVEIWTPNIVGKNYRYIKRSDASNGTGTTRRIHWRRGHFRAQPYGHAIDVCVCGESRTDHGTDSIICDEFKFDFRIYDSVKSIWIDHQLIGEKDNDGK